LRTTMLWHQLSMQPQWIGNVYGDTPPALRECRLSTVGISQNNDMDLLLHVEQMPPEHLWPKRWGKKCNRVAIELVLSGIQAVCIEGWSGNNVADVEMRRADDGRSVVLIASGAWGRIMATSAWLRIGKLQGYRAEEGYEGPRTPKRIG
jgi:hypothetical protein